MLKELWCEILYLIHSLCRLSAHGTKERAMSVWSLLWAVQSEEDGWMPSGQRGRHREGTAAVHVYDLIGRLRWERTEARKAAERTKRSLALA